MLFNLIFLSLFAIGWLICAFLPWLILSVATRGRAGMAYLPLCLFAGVVAGIAVPVLGLDDGTGLIVSFAMAAAVPTMLLLLGRYSRGSRAALAEARRSLHHREKDAQPE